MHSPDPIPVPEPAKLPSRPARPRFLDPRRQAGFLPTFYPTANGSTPPPPGTNTPHLRVQLEFLAAYYQINRAQAALATARSLPPSSRRTGRERAALRQVETALRRRDALEDHYAPRGVIAEATLRHGQVVDLRFTHGDVNALGQLRSAGYVFAAYVPLNAGAQAQIQPIPFETAQRLLAQHRPPPNA